MSSPDAQAIDNAGLLSDATLAAMGLRQQPFTATSADGDHFADDTTADQLADIKQALITGDDLLLILGETGAGKSTLISQLAANSGLRIQCFTVRGGPRFTTRHLFAGMLDAFQPGASRDTGDDLKATLDALIPQLQNMVANNMLGAILLDDADRVAESELTRLLSAMLYLNSQDETLLRIALAAEDSFEERIPELLPEGADLPYSSLTVEPFSPERAAAYLEFRLNQAGFFDAYPFSERDMQALDEHAGGKPAALHREAAGELNERHGAMPDVLPPELLGAQQGTASRARTGQLAIGGLALAMILGGLLLFRPTPESTTERYPDARAADSTDSTEPRIRLIGETDGQRANADAATESAGEPLRTTPLATGSIDPEPAAARSSMPATAAPQPSVAATPPSDEASAADADSGGAGGVASDATDSASSEVDEAPTVAPTTTESPPATARPTATSAAQAEPLPDTAPAPTEAPVDVAVAETSRPNPAPTPDPEPAPIAAPEAAPAGALGRLESPNWILVQDPSQFTVQMSASTERASVESFLERTDLDSPNSIFAFDRDGTTWYALVHGLYPSIEVARSEIERMPATAQSNQPWIRAVGRIQNALKEQN